MASTTSFTVVPNAFLMSLMVSSCTRALARLRRALTAPFHGVRGATSGVPPASCSGSRRRLMTASTNFTDCPSTLANWAGCFSLERSAKLTISRSVGMRSASRGAMGLSGPGSGLCCSRCMTSSEPATPSTAAWWNFMNKQKRPRSRPSMTHASHSGRERSSGVL